ncbi:hypothetical protein [Nocardioides luteus]|uniref:Glycosyltransferase subfamily 4-like N-terminal domain-containing protein n=1 Tax=Nocardioides luteus TaxID=1844 RepID=A0A1J4MXV7_9ACTN|nr:hypothetical protein [Nocardioides luteus]OIJ24106.1 hypothetical protein UG56_024555 [Nocardioides luteus]
MSDRLDDNHHTLEEMYAAAAAAGRRRPQRAAALAQAAAEFAWGNHTGWFAYEPLEVLLSDLGRSLPSVPAPARPRRTLHVVTQMYQSGGHTQIIAGWTDQLADHAHEIVATRHMTSPVPAKIASRLGDRVGLTMLDTTPGSLMHRAARLRALASTADLVVSHCHPFDVVPTLAFADRRGLPPVVYIDNTDHVFWVGVRAYDRVVHLRRSGQDLALHRRGLPMERSVLRNRPLAVRGRTRRRETAKPQWRVPASDVLVVTAADSSKFQGGDTYFAAVEAAVAAEPRLQWRVAGPDPDSEPWAGLARRTSGRIQAVGMLPDVAPLHLAADAYLDSFPFAGLTSLLESGGLANPVVTFRGHRPECAVWGSDSPGIDHLMLRPKTPDQLRDTLIDLVRRPRERVTRGTATAQAILECHTGPGWVAEAESLYRMPQLLDDDFLPPVRGRGHLDLLTVSVQATNPFSRTSADITAGLLGAMPLTDRLAIWRQTRRGGAGRLRDLAPEWAAAAVRARLRRRGGVIPG